MDKIKYLEYKFKSIIFLVCGPICTGIAVIGLINIGYIRGDEIAELILTFFALIISLMMVVAGIMMRIKMRNYNSVSISRSQSRILTL